MFVNKPHLKDVTLMAIDGGDLNTFRAALDITLSLCDFADVKLMHRDVDPSEGIPIPPMDYEGYNRFLVKEMYKYCDTSHMLVIQSDGFVLNPRAWTSEFLKYDWLGAPWPYYKTGINVGNGGFSLRSRRMMELAASIEVEEYAPEDQVLLRDHGEFFEEAGMKFAPLSVGYQFSQETGVWNGSFGFHGKKITDITAWFANRQYNVNDVHGIFIFSDLGELITCNTAPPLQSRRIIR